MKILIHSRPKDGAVVFTATDGYSCTDLLKRLKFKFDPNLMVADYFGPGWRLAVADRERLTLRAYLRSEGFDIEDRSDTGMLEWVTTRIWLGGDAKAAQRTLSKVHASGCSREEAATAHVLAHVKAHPLPDNVPYKTFIVESWLGSDPRHGDGRPVLWHNHSVTVTRG